MKTKTKIVQDFYKFTLYKKGFDLFLSLEIKPLSVEFGFYFFEYAFNPANILSITSIYYLDHMLYS